MIGHPFTWSFWSAAVCGVLLYGAAAHRAMDVVWHWAPSKADPAQLRRERRWETAILLGHWSMACLASAAFLGLVGITVVWHGMIAGAMCGTGVLQAMGGHGGRAMVFWGIALLVLHGWRVLDRLDSQHPAGMLAPRAARVLLVAAPMLVLALFHSWQAFAAIHGSGPVSCCAAVYDQVLQPLTGISGQPRAVTCAGWGSMAAGVVLLVVAGLKMRFPHWRSGTLVAALSLAWAMAAATTVKHVWSAYYFQVLSHPCAWCLFLPDAHGAGFVIYGCMALVIMDGTALWLSDGVNRDYPPLAEAALAAARRAARRMVIALVVFAVFSAGPAVVWRLHTGFWLDGTLF